MSNITVEEAKSERDKLQKEINALVRAFHAKTGVVVTSLPVHHMEKMDAEVVDHFVTVDTSL